ncbi:hypothetical protein [Streptomyces parvulus]|uniref:hypothetical protein n=1 Tax=Streptomyces parvulus TaxID=146923 RepID=UPI003794EB20
MPKPWEIVQRIAEWVMLIEWSLWKARGIIASLGETGEALSSNRDKILSLFRRSSR